MWSYFATVWFSFGGPTPGGGTFYIPCDEYGCDTSRISASTSTCEGLRIQSYTPLYFNLEPRLTCERYPYGAIVRVRFYRVNPPGNHVK
jgi:hypothetical protein